MESHSDDSDGSNDLDIPNYKHTGLTDIKQVNANEYSFSNKTNSKNKEKPNKPEAGMNEDNAIEIINVEFEELKEWIKFKMRYLKRECTDIIDSIKLQIEENNEYY